MTLRLRHPMIALATAGLCLAALFVYQPARAIVPGANGRIVFTSDRTGANPGSGNYDDFEIWSMNADGSDLKQLTNRPGEDREPVWSPDGTKIAFVSYGKDTSIPVAERVVGSSSDIFVMNPDGTGITNLTKTSGFDDEPAWSPDGLKIAWRTNRANNDAEVFVMNADGSNQAQLTNHAGVDDEPAFSPDGQKIAIRRCNPASGPDPNHCDLSVMNADGTNVVDIGAASGGAKDDPAWTPDGAKIAFRSYGSGGAPDIHVVNAADGSAKTNLTNDPDSNVDPAFSPDGTKLTYVRQPAVQSKERTGNGDIWALDVANPATQVNLTNTPGFEGDPDWQRLSGGTTNTTTTTAPPGGSSTTTTTVPPGGKARSGYWMVGADGRVFSFGEAAHRGDALILAGAEAVDLEPTPSGNGYWVVDSAGRVFAMGDAKFLGVAAPTALTAGEKVTSLSSTKTGNGYWMFTTKGRVLTFGDATHYGDMAATRLNGPVLDSIPTASGRGYYMVASDGGIFSFGDAKFYGSMGDKKLNAPVQSLVPDGDGVGYWLVASDGGIFAFEAPFKGSMGNVRLNKPVTGMVRFGNGYLMVGEDGGIFNFSDKQFHGSLGGNPPPRPVVSVAAID
jgi:Tol biopolymer transport system component